MPAGYIIDFVETIFNSIHPDGWNFIDDTWKFCRCILSRKTLCVGGVWPLRWTMTRWHIPGHQKWKPIHQHFRRCQKPASKLEVHSINNPKFGAQNEQGGYILVGSGGPSVVPRMTSALLTRPGPHQSYQGTEDLEPMSEEVFGHNLLKP